MNFGRFADSGELFFELFRLVFDRFFVGFRVGAVGQLHGELADALEHLLHIVECALRGLHERDRFLSVLRRPA